MKYDDLNEAVKSVLVAEAWIENPTPKQIAEVKKNCSAILKQYKKEVKELLGVNAKLAKASALVKKFNAELGKLPPEVKHRLELCYLWDISSDRDDEVMENIKYLEKALK